MFINKKTYHLQMKLLYIFTISFCLTACISRLSRPEMTGQVVDESGQPIPLAQIGESISDDHGFFRLNERRYFAFLLKEIVYMEAPPVFVQEQVSKSGYQTCYLHYSHPFGGGQRKGAQLQLGQVMLNTNFNAKILNQFLDCTIKTQEK